ncbi:7104_t:CDS:2 [Funneliformis geosporum]|uniref:7104_t:CDS:1 n=1 Tax=Funneliformis geosporum TaxID=1117311 RepID=A0A9W4WPF4_9GLOM|nr:7104_t:CDS:2 [Funneliformis geosporum]
MIFINHLILIISLPFVIIRGTNAADSPEARWGHAAVLLDNILYISGGKLGEDKNNFNDTKQNSNQLITLDMTKSFSVSDPTWTILSVGPSVAEHTLSIGGPQNELLVLCGGNYPDPVPENPIFYYNTLEQSPNWVNVNITLPIKLREHTAVTRLSDSMNYFYGGIDTDDPNVSVRVQLQDLLQLDTRQNILDDLKVDPKTPPGRFHHTATILPDGKMYVIGGYSGDNTGTLVDMSQIFVFDTLNSMWNIQVAIGTLPLARRDHVAVGTQDGKVIIHGGANANYDVLYNDTAILDTTKLQFTWSLINTSGKIPPSRYSHTATLVGTNMLIAFGVINSKENGDFVDDNIYVLDTNTYEWKENYTPKNLDFTMTSKSTGMIIEPHKAVSHAPMKIGIIVGLVIGIIIFLLLTVGSLLLFFRKRKQVAIKSTSYEIYKEQSSNQIRK